MDSGMYNEGCDGCLTAKELLKIQYNFVSVSKKHSIPGAKGKATRKLSFPASCALPIQATCAFQHENLAKSSANAKLG